MTPDSAIEPPEQGQFLVYQAEDGKLKLDVRLQGETVWLTQQHMAELFQTSKQNISQHLKQIFAEGELVEEAVVKIFFTTASDGRRGALLTLNECDILQNAGRISHELAKEFAERAYDKFHQKRLDRSAAMTSDFDRALKQPPATQRARCTRETT